MDEGEDEEEEGKGAGLVKEDDQKSLSVGIIGAPNAGKSALTNYMVGTKVAAVSRKTNTTTHEVVGVLTKGDTQICFFDTPGLMLNCGGFPYRDVKVRVESAWSSVNLYEVLIVIFDVHRHITRPDSRVIQLIKRMGARSIPNQRRILCMNKIDLVEKKKDLLKVAEEFKDLPGYERYFMISGLKGSGVKDLTQYLMEQACIFLLLLSTRFQRPWEEDPFTMSEEVMKMIALEVVRERLLDHVHQEIPYDVEHRLIDWKELRDGSLRIEQHFITNKLSQCKILVGKNGSKIGRIGIEANEELRSIFKKQVHLILRVRHKK
ncbi:GTP-binding protein ERG [Glycine soja]|uniref:GTP-binding protein ERG n=1 Tax=Glycine soja TaxID=3848 RepID=A0A0B2RMP5_GLYSO|nr:GTP-binding protein ERG [Glycine soja]